jgi:hypothetical protein
MFFDALTWMQHFNEIDPSGWFLSVGGEGAELYVSVRAMILSLS